MTAPVTATNHSTSRWAPAWSAPMIVLSKSQLSGLRTHCKWRARAGDQGVGPRTKGHVCWREADADHPARAGIWRCWRRRCDPGRCDLGVRCRTHCDQVGDAQRETGREREGEGDREKTARFHYMTSGSDGANTSALPQLARLNRHHVLRLGLSLASHGSETTAVEPHAAASLRFPGYKVVASPISGFMS